MRRESVPAGRAAVEFSHRLLCGAAPATAALPEVLAELATAFDADNAGLAALADGAPLAACRPAADRAPWQTDPGLLRRLRHARTAVTAPRPEGGSLLLAALGAGRADTFAWLESRERDRWSDAEAAALALAADALARGAAARWAAQLDRLERQRRLETAADVARRLAHDYGNALTSILGFVELALAQPAPPDGPLPRYLAEARRGAESGALLTHQMRLFSRRNAAAPRPCSLGELLAEEVARLHAAGGNRARVETSLEPGLPAPAVDAEQLRAVLRVLLENAQEALAEPCVVVVAARPVDLSPADCLDYYGNAAPGPHVEIRVSDAGCGLSPEARDKLFAEPFFSTKSRRRGFGLAAAYGVLHAHRGGLLLEDGAERGTVARVVVPVAAAPAPVGDAGARADDGGEKVLVVDDDPLILGVVATTLRQAGYRVHACTKPEDALSSYAAEARDPFRLVVSDVTMPRITGVDLARRLLQQDAGVRVLFISGHVPEDVEPQDLAARQFDLLAKPFRPEGLLQAVRAALDRTPPRRPAHAG